MADRTPLAEVVAWMAAHPEVNASDAARAHGWKPDSLSKALRRQRARAEAQASAPTTGQSGRTAPVTVQLSDDVRQLVRSAMTGILRDLADPAWLEEASPGEKARVLGVLVDRFGSLLRIERDEESSSDQAVEAAALAAFGTGPDAPPDAPPDER